MQFQRDKTIRRLCLFIESSSDEQIIQIEEKILELRKDDKWDDFDIEPSRNYTQSDIPFLSEDIEEGNYGTLYRNK